MPVNREKLIELVRKNDCLYKKGKKYKIKSQIAQVWVKIGAELGIDAMERMADESFSLPAASSAWNLMASLCSEQRIWRELVLFHFTPAQIEGVTEKKDDEGEEECENNKKQKIEVDWKTVFHKLRKHYGLREDTQFAETLSLCRHCKCLFWRSLGHPCIADQCPEYASRLKEAGGPLPPHPVPPAAFLKFFSL